MNIYEFARHMIDRIEEFKEEQIRHGLTDEEPAEDLFDAFVEWMSTYEGP